jgi:hypothetical protein
LAGTLTWLRAADILGHPAFNHPAFNVRHFYHLARRDHGVTLS